mmetsp:Transcript_37767/g.90715  ORF Transcript_37767/g.90715 Transcript_37767/m.90715 type:complete len:160 (+) Transcript_37767:100-579(+)
MIIELGVVICAKCKEGWTETSCRNCGDYKDFKPTNRDGQQFGLPEGATDADLDACGEFSDEEESEDVPKENSNGRLSSELTARSGTSSTVRSSSVCSRLSFGDVSDPDVASAESSAGQAFTPPSQLPRAYRAEPPLRSHLRSAALAAIELTHGDLDRTC